MRAVPSDVLEVLKRVKKDYPRGYLELRRARNGFYLYNSHSVWNSEKKRPDKRPEYLGRVTVEGVFLPSGTRRVCTVDRDSYEYGNCVLAYIFLSDVHELLSKYTGFADELVAMGVLGAVSPGPVRLYRSKWEKLYLSRLLQVNLEKTRAGKILFETGKNVSWWYCFFSRLIG